MEMKPGKQLVTGDIFELGDRRYEVVTDAYDFEMGRGYEVKARNLATGDLLNMRHVQLEQFHVVN